MKSYSPFTGRVEETEFTTDQLYRLDQLQEAAGQFLYALLETDDPSLDLDDIWELIYTGAICLTKRGYRVRIPTHVTTPDGKDYITDWYGEDESIADMEHK